MTAAIMAIEKEKDLIEWTGLFPNDVNSKEGSLVYLKRMLAVAVSTITYLRGILPENAYCTRYLEDVCFKILRKDSSIPRARNVVKWLFGCFDALEKQYLEVVFIGVYTDPDKPNCIIESYSFKFKYRETGPEMDILRTNGVQLKVTLEDTKRATVILIRQLSLLMQNLNILPDHIHISMKLYYYDNVTPALYEPPGFKEGGCDSLWFEGTAVHFEVGDVQTALHAFHVRVSADTSRIANLGDRKKPIDTKPTNASGEENIEGPGEIVCVDDEKPFGNGKLICCRHSTSDIYKAPLTPKSYRFGAVQRSRNQEKGNCQTEDKNEKKTSSVTFSRRSISTVVTNVRFLVCLLTRLNCKRTCEYFISSRFLVLFTRLSPGIPCVVGAVHNWCKANCCGTFSVSVQ
ncbi:zebrafish testis-expressed 38 isoform X3 [Syngnathus scovelli]|uniref:zebrafish testis-expressed 38 isoform X3 n=1 Tax=Syngnathus scovelli TaxID=161590 RepID=UPI002110199E|nr:zebrafish testis-expressed 38 isoform X3 [Syngnathus scovelli]